MCYMVVVVSGFTVVECMDWSHQNVTSTEWVEWSMSPEEEHGIRTMFRFDSRSVGRELQLDIRHFAVSPCPENELRWSIFLSLVLNTR